MRLLRITVITFDPFPEAWLSFGMDFKGVNAGTIPPWSDKEKGRIFVVGDVKLEGRPFLNQDDAIIIPDEPRRRIEQAIETIANMIAVSERCVRHLYSTHPSVALIPENPGDLAWLESTKGIYLSSFNQGAVRPRQPITVESLLANCQDRLDGIALLAEAHAHSHVMGKYHEFVRFFELAFTSFDAALLFKYLKIAENFGYTRAEINNWRNLRDPSTHADFKKTQSLSFGDDIQPIISRMEQAVYDVLLNKIVWHHTSTERRKIWRPVTGSASADADLFITTGEPANLEFNAFDPFGCYPLYLPWFPVGLPEGWWFKEHKTTSDNRSSCN